MTYEKMVQNLISFADKKTANQTMKFFKMQEGEYGYGDKFLGVKMQEIRNLAKKYKDAPLHDVERLLSDKYHEARSLALVILVGKYSSSDSVGRREIFDIYLKNVSGVNNWDLVDISAHHIVGSYAFENEDGVLDRLVLSETMWERRIAVVSTWYYIKKGVFEKTFKMVSLLLDDREDLMHKSSGWMLREVGKMDKSALEGFLRENYKKMPRTMLRYAIERFPEAERQNFLKGRV